jgi:NitT/TauT family transport system ATP-binding protein
MNIVFEDISKTFAEYTERAVSALDKVSFTIAEHEFVSIVGPSGCGKTTLLKIAAGLIKPNTGHITFTDTQRTPSTAMVFQDQGLLPWLTVMDNIGFGLEMKKVPKDVRRKQVLEFMRRVKLDGFENYYVHELSGGMCQRVALARAFLSNPDILLMDEPFGSLDAQTRIILQEELLNIWKEEQKTVIFVTHDIDEAVLLSDRIIVLSDRPGRIQQIIQVPLERPRALKVKDDPRFTEIRWQIWKLLEQQVRKELKLT